MASNVVTTDQKIVADELITGSIDKYVSRFESIAESQTKAERSLTVKLQGFVDYLIQNEPTPVARIAAIEAMLKRWPKEKREVDSKASSAYQIMSRFKPIYGAVSRHGLKLEGAFNSLYDESRALLKAKGEDWKGTPIKQSSDPLLEATNAAADTARKLAIESGMPPEKADELFESIKATREQNDEEQRIGAKAATIVKGLMKQARDDGHEYGWVLSVIKAMEKSAKSQIDAAEKAKKDEQAKADKMAEGVTINKGQPEFKETAVSQQ